MERARQPLTDTMIGAKAPSAAQPGRGIGNIPYAKGMASGQFGSRVAAIQSGQPTEPVPGPASPPAQGPPASGGAPPPMGPPPNLGARSPVLDPMFYFDFMATYVQALLNAANSPGGFY